MTRKAVKAASETTQLRLAMRTMRANYLQNVREGRCQHDPQALADFDKHLETLNARAKGLPQKR